MGSLSDLLNGNLADNRTTGTQGRGDNDESGEKTPADKSILDILTKNLESSIHKSDGTTEEASKSGKTSHPISRLKMDGDIGQLCLQNTFFVGGVKIGWPFPAILPPQRQMAFHIIQALKRKLHVVLESPTGTGKSAAILCSVLAWQRYHVQRQQAAGKDSASAIHQHSPKTGTFCMSRQFLPSSIARAPTHR